MLHPERTVALLLALGLSACVATLETPDGGAGVAVFGESFGYRDTGPPGCARPIAEFAAILADDHRTGNVHPTVYRRATADLSDVRSACAAGRIGEARDRLDVVKARYGYH
ncbi:MAG TPA: hypothetical protein VFQ27_00505 [Xanthobacteraceae bacterium]|nr:hypothetical protein [Xanthobacteraceae bacterium]